MKIEKIELPEPTPYKIVAMGFYTDTIVIATEHYVYFYSQEEKVFKPIKFQKIDE